MVNQIKI